MKNLQVEAEGSELILKNKAGDHVIIPKDMRKRVQRMLDRNCHGCIDAVVSKLPTMESYAEDGTLIPENEVPDPEPKVKQVKPTKEAYQTGLKSYYEQNRKANAGFIEDTPYPEHMDRKQMEGNNCINGVCTVLKKAVPGSIKDNYTGNIAFRDSYKKEGFYKIPDDDLKHKGFEVGDVIQYGLPRHQYVEKRKTADAAALKASMTNATKYDFTPGHGVVVLDSFEKDGSRYYTVGNNQGNDKMREEVLSHEELMKRKQTGIKGYTTYESYRYDPTEVKNREEAERIETEVLKGNNEHAKAYTPGTKLNFKAVPGINLETLKPDEIGDGSTADSDAAEKLIPVYEKNFAQIGKVANVPPTVLEKLIKSQIGIAAQESRLGSSAAYNVKEILPNAVIPALRKLDSRKKDDWIKDYWDRNADGVQGEFDNYKAFKADVASETGYTLPAEDKKEAIDNSPASNGWWQQKELSTRGKHMKYNLDLGNTEGQAMASLALALDNYHLLKKKYPDASEDKLVDLTTLMHAAPYKALSKRFVKYYYDNPDSKDPAKTVDYVNKVNAFKNAILTDKTKK